MSSTLESAGLDGADSCMATWSLVYRLQSGVFVDRSVAFPKSYRDRLESLKAEISGRKKNREGDDGIVCLQIEAGKIRRFLGTSPKAGENRAIQWGNSRNGYLRRKGICCSCGYRRRIFLATLESYTKDSDRNVAEETALALLLLRK